MCLTPSLIYRERKTEIKRENRWNMKEIHCKGNIFLTIWNSIIFRKLSQQKFVELRNRNWNGEKNKNWCLYIRTTNSLSFLHFQSIGYININFIVKGKSGNDFSQYDLINI